MSLLHIVTKIKAFEEMVGHFEKWPPRSPGGAADLGPYLKIISRGCFICVPSVMLLTQSARFYQKWPLTAPLLGIYTNGEDSAETVWQHRLA